MTEKTKKKNIAVIFGGKSTEHDVSIITAHLPIIESLLTKSEYEVWPIYISKDGSWYSDQAMNKLSYFKNPDYEKNLIKQKKLELLFDDGLKIIWSGIMSKTIKIDLVFPAMHGTYGEDGSLAGLLRMAHVPFVGCDLFASVVSMDKVLTKQVLFAEDVPIVPFVWFTRSEWNKDKNIIHEKIKNLKFPLFVKPVHLGSSIGIAKVKQDSELDSAIEVALHYDEKVLVEEGVNNLIEVTLPILGNDGSVKLAGIEQPLNKTDFFDFNDKYLSGGKKSGGVNNQYSVIPAKIDVGLAEQVKNFGEKTYRILGCSGTARIDFLIDDKNKKVYVNEVNTLPGGLYDHNWRKMGVSGVELVEKLIALAEERFNENEKITYTFNSTILKQVNGPKIQP